MPSKDNSTSDSKHVEKNKCDTCPTTTRKLVLATKQLPHRATARKIHTAINYYIFLPWSCQSEVVCIGSLFWGSSFWATVLSKIWVEQIGNQIISRATSRINMADYSPPRKRYRKEEEGPKSEEDDENYVPYVPLKERRKTAVSF